MRHRFRLFFGLSALGVLANHAHKAGDLPWVVILVLSTIVFSCLDDRR
jgi:hypothetical protein